MQPLNHGDQNPRGRVCCTMQKVQTKSKRNVQEIVLQPAQPNNNFHHSQGQGGCGTGSGGSVRLSGGMWVHCTLWQRLCRGRSWATAPLCLSGAALPDSVPKSTRLLAVPCSARRGTVPLTSSCRVLSMLPTCPALKFSLTSNSERASMVPLSCDKEKSSSRSSSPLSCQAMGSRVSFFRTKVLLSVLQRQEGTWHSCWTVTPASPLNAAPSMALGAAPSMPQKPESNVFSFSQVLQCLWDD